MLMITRNKKTIAAAIAAVLVPMAFSAANAQTAEPNRPQEKRMPKYVNLPTSARLMPERLLEAIDLDRPGLEGVRDRVAAKDEAGAMAALLAYYRARKNVAFQVERLLGADANASSETIGRANDVLRHVFVARPSMLDLGYAPQDYGPNIDWGSDPIPDVSWRAVMNRFDWDTYLASAYVTTHDQKYAAGWVDLAKDWIAKNPADAPLHIYAYYSLGIGVRAERWCADFELYKSSPAFTPEFLRTFLAAAHDHAEVSMQTDRAKTTGAPPHLNPAIVEADGLLRLALEFPEFKRAAAWREKSLADLLDTAQHQVTADGVHYEWSINYHMACAGRLAEDVELLRRSGLEAAPELLKIIAAMYDYLLAAISPDRLYPMFSDARRPGHDIVAALQRGARLFDRPQYAAVLDERADGYPRERNFAFPAAGMYFMRSGWDRDAVYAAFHCSPPSRSAHDQPDNGTFEIHAFGRWVMPDTGCFAYGHGNAEAAERPLFCRTASHQTLTQNGQNSTNASRHRLWQDMGDSAAVVFENASYTSWTHRRSAFFVNRAFFVLVDEAIGEPNGALDLHFQLAAGPAKLDPAARSARTAFADGGNVLVWTPPDAPVDMAEEAGWTSSQFFKKEQRPAFAYRHRAGRNAVFVTVVAPFRSDRAPAVSGAMPKVQAGDDRVEFTVTVDGTTWRLGRDLAAGKAWCQKQ